MANVYRGEPEPIQRLTQRPAEALAFRTEAEAIEAAGLLRRFGVLRGVLRPVRVRRRWLLRYGEDEDGLWLHDPDR